MKCVSQELGTLHGLPRMDPSQKASETFATIEAFLCVRHNRAVGVVFGILAGFSLYILWSSTISFQSQPFHTINLTRPPYASKEWIHLHRGLISILHVHLDLFIFWQDLRYAEFDLMIKVRRKSFIEPFHPSPRSQKVSYWPEYSQKWLWMVPSHPGLLMTEEATHVFPHLPHEYFFFAIIERTSCLAQLKAFGFSTDWHILPQVPSTCLPVFL